MFLNNIFYLMNKDEPLLKFECNRNEFDLYFIEKERYREGLPYGFENIEQWIQNRQAPKHRQYIAELLRECGCYDLDGYIRVTHGLSLNDTFWIKEENSNLKWIDVSLYRNEFDETIARIAFEGGLYGRQFTTTSPEFGTSGAFAKCWIREPEGIYLLKRGSDGGRNTGLEIYSEAYASQLAEIICNESVSYEVVEHHHKLASKCKLFTSEEKGFVPMSHFFRSMPKVTQLLEICEKNGCADDFRRMIVLDALTLNTDRHMGNYGFIFDCDTLIIKGMAPIFDNNQALLPYAEDEEFNNLDAYLRSRPTRIGDDFNSIAHAMLTPAIKADLINLDGFTFKKYDNYNLPAERLQILEKVVQLQISNIIGNIRLYNPGIPNESVFELNAKDLEHASNEKGQQIKQKAANKEKNVKK